MSSDAAIGETPSRVRPPRRDAVGRLLAALEDDGPLAVVCLALVVFGVVLRVQDLGFPDALSWDEHHFVLNARNYIAHQHDWNDHPPLGKLLIEIGMLAVGDTSVGYRLSSFFFGLVAILLAGGLATTLFGDRRAGWIAAAFAACDGFLISYSRTALLDGVLTTLILLAAWLALSSRAMWRTALSAAVIGGAAGVKLSGFAIGFPLIALCLVRPRPWLRLPLLSLALVTFAAQFSLGLYLAREPHDLAAVFRGTSDIVKHHAALTEFKHPLTSHWYTWWLPARPIVLRFDRAGLDQVRVMSTLGNLLLWWAAAVALLVEAVVSVRAVLEVARHRGRLDVLTRDETATAALFGFTLAMLLPWIIGHRDSYIYHYLPSYAFLLIFLGGAAARLYRRHPSAGVAAVSAVMVVSAFYAPIWGQLPLTIPAYEARLFLPMWR